MGADSRLQWGTIVCADLLKHDLACPSGWAFIFLPFFKCTGNKRTLPAYIEVRKGGDVTNGDIDGNTINWAYQELKKFWKHKGNNTAYAILQTIDAVYKDGCKPLLVKMKKYPDRVWLLFSLPFGESYARFKELEHLFAEAIGGMVVIELEGRAIHLTAYQQQLKTSSQGGYPYTKCLDPSLFSPKMLMPIHFGFSALGPMIYDLADLEGILIGGNRGTGKSYLIISICTSLLQYSDAIVGIIDYKRADTEHFRPYVGYAGDEITARRMVRAINKELTKRISWFAACKANTLLKMRAKGHDVKPIVVILDELSEILDEQTLTGINRLLRLGRSLGIYVVGATQRPSSTNVKNNWGDSKALLPTRICFSVVDSINSHMILDNDLGATIPLSHKGRCIFQFDKNIETQTLYLEPEESERLLKEAEVSPERSEVIIYEQLPKRLPARPLHTEGDRKEQVPELGPGHDTFLW